MTQEAAYNSRSYKAKQMEIILSHINKAYAGKPVLKDVSLTIRTGEAILVSGPSGIGKTTLLRILLGLETPDSGQIHIPEHVHFGVDFQEDHLLEKASAVENVRLVINGKGKITGDQIRNELSSLLPKDELDKPAGELSGGMKRRLCLVRAMILPKDIYVLDEPFTGLDPENRKKCIAYIKSHVRQSALVISSHELEGLEWMKIVRLR